MMAHRSTRPSCLIGAFLPVLLSGLVAGCSLTERQFEALEAHDRSHYQERYPVRAELQRARVDISGARGNGPARSSAYFDAVRAVRAYTQEGRGPLHVVAPARGADHDVTMVRRVIQATGLSASQVRFSTRRDGGRAVTLSYDRIAAIGPDECYDLSALVERRPDGETGNAFGCASQKNLAAMIADPSDLAVPAATPDRGSERRATLHKTYRETVRKDFRLEP